MENKQKVLIIDDNAENIKIAANFIKNSELIIWTAMNGKTGIELAKAKHPDIILLDIQMPEISGIEFAKILPKETRIIFTTAFNQYAIDGYSVNALDYLLKPISYVDFMTAVSKAMDYFSFIRKQETYKKDRFMFVKSEYKLIRVPLDNILYIEGLKDYIRIYLENGAKIMSLMNMKKLEEYLPTPEFMRTHRSYIVHMTKINSVDHFRIVFGEDYLPISDTYKENVLMYLDRHTLN